MRLLKYNKFFESNKYDKVIFLDIDGVLKPIISKDERMKDKYGDLFNNHNIDILASIIEQTGAKIVITSTWKYNGLDNMRNLWQYRNLPGEIIDITPSEMDVVDAGMEDFYDLVKRGHEIQLWIDNNNFKGNYVILDDVEDFLENQQSHFIKIDSTNRLDDRYVDRIISVLNKNI